MAEKQLIVVVEGTAALGPYWQTVVSDYLEKIVRCFCGNELNGQKLSGAHPELALVVFNSHGPYSAFLVQRSGWTKDLDVFLLWLSRIPFSGGGFGDAAIAEGLSDALTMFPVSINGSQNLQNLDGQKHCILVAASNPYPLPTPVYSPPNLSLSAEQGESPEAQTGTCFGDAEGVAKSFGQFFISLSVICPRQLPKLRAIFNAGRRNPRAADPTIDNAKNSYFTVLISENFLEARAALSHPFIGNSATNQGTVKADAAAIPGPASTSITSVNGSMINRQQPLGNIPPAAVKVEPTTVPTMISGPGYPHLAPISSVSSQGVPTLQTSSPSPTSQEMNVASEVMQEHKPLVNPMSQTLRPVGAAQANVNILNNLSQHRQVMNSASITGANSIGLQTIGGTPMAMHMSNMISSGMTSSGISGITSVSGSGALMPTAQVAQNTSIGSFTSTNSHVSGNSNMGISPALTNLQNSIGMGQYVQGMGQGNLTQSAQTGQGGINMTPGIMNELGPTGMSSAPGTMIPTPGMSQQSSVNSLGMTNNTAMNMPLTQQAQSGQQPQSKYVKIWEGALSGQRQGHPVFICKLEGYRSATASET